ncbi:MAG: sialidase family protein [Pirellulaceae bacterium]
MRRTVPQLNHGLLNQPSREAEHDDHSPNAAKRQPRQGGFIAIDGGAWLAVGVGRGLKCLSVGGQLTMWCRTDQARQYVSYSENGGETWSELAASNIVSPRSPASLERVPSTGDLLLVWNHRDVANKEPRTPLTLAVSTDEGQTWSHEKTLETDPEGVFCYTAIAFVDEHVLLSYYTGGGSGRITRVPLAWIYQ